ncbi:MAG TPA: hypothetical protein DCD96_07680 [Flavobacteriales bacterium]|nr:hypothetical protein [Flavobacteriales bacterium]
MAIPNTNTKESILQNRKFYNFLSIVVIGICVLVLLGWAADIAVLKHILPWAIAMNPTTAVCFIMAAFSLFLFTSERQKESYSRISLFLSITILCIGSIKLISVFLNTDTGIDSILFNNKLASEITAGMPNRMSPNTAVGFVSIGTATILMILTRNSTNAIFQYFALFAWLLGLQSILGYIYNVKAFYKFEAFLPIALHTGVCFFILANIILLSNTGKGFMRHFFNPTSGAITVRKLLMYAILVPILLGLLRILADNHGFIKGDLGIAIMILFNILTLLVLIWFTARELNKRDISRRQTEESLKFSLKEVSDLKFALDETAIITYIDTNAIITKVNEKFCKISQYTSDELTGRNFRIINNENNQESVLLELWSTISSGITWRGEIKHKSKNGDIYWIDTTVVPFLDENNKPFKYISIGNDISERKRTEERIAILNAELQKQMEASLQTFESVLKKTQKIANLGTWEFDFATNKIAWSEEAYRIYGIDNHSKSITPDEYLNLVHEDDRNEVMIKINTALQSKSEISFFNRIIRQNDGYERYIYSETLANFDRDGNPIKLFGIAHDVTEVISVQKDLSKSKERHKELLNNMNDGFVVNDSEGKIIYANQQFLKMFDIRSEDLDKFNWEMVVAPEFIQQFKVRFIRDKHDSPEAGMFEFRCIRKGGESIWIEARVNSVLENGHVSGTQAVLSDITEKKKQEEELQKTAIELTNRVNELMQFNYIVSHNLRVPIANILGLSSLIEHPNIDIAEKQKAIHHIREATLKMDELVRDLNMVLATRSNINSKKQEICLSGIVRNIQETLEKQISETNAIINQEISNEADKFYSVKSYIESIFYNIISNAIKYRSGKQPRINVNAKLEGKIVHISISDNGRGIDLKKHGDSLFGLYKRFHFDTEGKGLGLFMTRIQVEALGGTIDVHSILNEGTTFIINLPI